MVGNLPINHAAIQRLIPHQGAMCLLHQALAWDDRRIRCTAVSHLDADNPLRRAGRLSAVCGVEYALQAAALHGALLDDATPALPGHLASLRGVAVAVPFLDDAGFGALHIAAEMVHRDGSGLLYEFRITAASGAALLSGRGMISLGKPA